MRSRFHAHAWPCFTGGSAGSRGRAQRLCSLHARRPEGAPRVTMRCERKRRCAHLDRSALNSAFALACPDALSLFFPCRIFSTKHSGWYKNALDNDISQSCSYTRAHRRVRLPTVAATANKQHNSQRQLTTDRRPGERGRRSAPAWSVWVRLVEKPGQVRIRGCTLSRTFKGRLSMSLVKPHVPAATSERTCSEIRRIHGNGRSLEHLLPRCRGARTPVSHPRLNRRPSAEPPGRAHSASARSSQPP